MIKIFIGETSECFAGGRKKYPGAAGVRVTAPVYQQRDEKKITGGLGGAADASRV